MIALLLTPSHAYQLLGDDWAWQQDPIAQDILLNTASFPSSIGTPDEIEQALATGIEAWNGVAHLDLRTGGTTAATWEAEGDLVLFWDSEIADGAVIASASGWGWGGTIRDCDVAFWAGNDWGPIDWDTEEATWTTDLAEVATHEIGHCLGFDHSDDWSASMQSMSRGWRGIEQDDRDGLLAMYGNCVDADGDGFACDDCDDSNSAVHPGAIEVCDGVDDDCNGAVDEVVSTVTAFGSPDRQSSERDDSAWLTLFEVDSDTALVSFAQELELSSEQWVSFTVVDITVGQTPSRTVRLAQVPAGTGMVESPNMDVALIGGHTYAIGAGAMQGIRHAYSDGAGAPAHGLTPMGARWTSYAPGLGTGWQPHGAHQPVMELRLIDVDLDGDGTTGFCGDCDDHDPDAISPADCAVVDPTEPTGDPSEPIDDPTVPEGDPDEGSEGCASGAWSMAFVAPLALGLRRRF